MDSLLFTAITPATPAAKRATLTFSVEGLQAREELLIKSFIRLIDHLTKQQWVYQPPGGLAPIDLLLAAPGASAAFAARQGRLPLAVVEVGSDSTSPNYLSWPLKPGALEIELNRVGELAAAEAASLHAARPGPGRDQQASALLAAAMRPSPAAAANANENANVNAAVMRLKQWPPAHLLAGPGRLRLATLLTGRGMAMDELVGRSDLPQPMCETFVSELHRAGMLFHSAPIHFGAGMAALHADRSRAERSTDIVDLTDSLFTESFNGAPTDTPYGGSARSYDTHSPRIPGTAAAQPSLLARIRMRLGIKA